MQRSLLGYRKNPIDLKSINVLLTKNLSNKKYNNKKNTVLIIFIHIFIKKKIMYLLFLLFAEHFHVDQNNFCCSYNVN